MVKSFFFFFFWTFIKHSTPSIRSQAKGKKIDSDHHLTLWLDKYFAKISDLRLQPASLGHMCLTSGEFYLRKIF